MLLGAKHSSRDVEVLELVQSEPWLRERALTAWLSRNESGVGQTWRKALAGFLADDLRIAESLTTASSVVVAASVGGYVAERLERALRWERNALALRIVKISGILREDMALSRLLVL